MQKEKSWSLVLKVLESTMQKVSAPIFFFRVSPFFENPWIQSLIQVHVRPVLAPEPDIRCHSIRFAKKNGAMVQKANVSQG
jgi:hypothetical protein